MNFDQRHHDAQPSTKGEKAFLIIGVLIFLGMMFMEILSDYEPRKLGAVLILLFWIPLLFLHEFGHAVMAKMLGWHVRKTVIGVGQVLIRTTFFNAPMEIRMLPLEGFVQIAPVNLHYPRLKNALIYFAGPGIELLLFFIIMGILGTGQMFVANDDYFTITLQSLAYAALVGAVINLIPVGILTNDGRTPNDGLGIILCLFQPEENYQRWIKEAEDK